MRPSVSVLLALNKFFPLPVHPFNLQNEGKMTYAQWQFEKGADTIKFYNEVVTPEDMFSGRVVLDIGCGAAGKSLYYASLGAEKVYGIDVVEAYAEQSAALAKEKGFESKFEFRLCDAAATDFPDNFFDTIIMNDSMEHVAEPEKVLSECYRVLKKDGRLFVNFCPYYHPFGAHLSDAIGIPWVHMFFGEQTMIDAYKLLINDVPDRDSRIAFRFSKKPDGGDTISYINHMTIKRFNKILSASPFKVKYYREVPLRSVFTIPAKLPLFREMFVKMTVAILIK
ncbi:MAG: class I SAM-dependent methyltransferase [Oscillospiraceae bacterium]|nr:class I SAM-dependent methyltransferase [Oscillospiraceae bacterium]